MIEKNEFLKVDNIGKDLQYYFDTPKALAKTFSIKLKEAEERIQLGSFKIKSGWRSGIWEISKVSKSNVDEKYLRKIPDKKLGGQKEKRCLCGCGELVKTAGDDYLGSCWYRELTGKDPEDSSENQFGGSNDHPKVRRL